MQWFYSLHAVRQLESDNSYFRQQSPESLFSVGSSPSHLQPCNKIALRQRSAAESPGRNLYPKVRKAETGNKESKVLLFSL